MTASDDHSPSLPGILSLFTETLSLLRKNASVYFGYASWLLFPILLSVFLRSILDADRFLIANGLVQIFLYGVLVLYLTILFIVITPPLRAKTRIPETLHARIASVGIPYILTSFLVSIIVIPSFILVIPGFLFLVWLAFAGHRVVLSHDEIIPALKASKALVHGRYFAVFWRFIVGMMLIFFLYALLAIALLAIPAVLGITSFNEIFEATELTALEDTLISLLEILSLPVFTVYTTLLYLHLQETMKIK
jgi:hypothetical protein